MIKVYKMNGKTESHEIFASASGKTKIKVTFAKGNLDPKNRVPAKYATASPVVQHMIEHSPKFGKTIFLDKTFGSEESASTVAAPIQKGKAGKVKAADPKLNLKEMPEVATLADAASVLIAEGASAAEIDGTIEGAIRVAKKYGISFPNLKGEE
jgi:hypothetical protein